VVHGLIEAEIKGKTKKVGWEVIYILIEAFSKLEMGE